MAYSWHRVGGSVPSRSIGQNSNTLTILRATPYDIRVYYCIAKRQGISVKSSEAVLRVNGKKLAMYGTTNNNYIIICEFYRSLVHQY